MVKLSVNIDHIATIREARKIHYPDPVYGAVLAELVNVDGITLHLREDRRHIQDRDLSVLKETVKSKLNLEMAVVPEMIDIACKTKPEIVTLVPEKRKEITTEGGLDVVKNMEQIKNAIKKLKKAGIITSLFVDPKESQILAAKRCGADEIELHTGQYALAMGENLIAKEYKRLYKSAKYAHNNGLIVNAGHGLNCANLAQIVKLPYLNTLNIGHSIIADAVFIGLSKAITNVKDIIHQNSN